MVDEKTALNCISAKYLDSETISEIEKLNVDDQTKKLICKMIVNSHYGLRGNNFPGVNMIVDEINIKEFITQLSDNKKKNLDVK